MPPVPLCQQSHYATRDPIEEALSVLEESESESDSEQLLLVLSDLCQLLLVVWIHWPFLVI